MDVPGDDIGVGIGHGDEGLVEILLGHAHRPQQRAMRRVLVSFFNQIGTHGNLLPSERIKKRAAFSRQPLFCFLFGCVFRSIRLLFGGCPHAFMALAKNEDHNSNFDSQKDEIHQGFLFNLF
jgi:hypothetical protein